MKAILVLDKMPKTCGQCTYFITEQIENNTVQYCLSGKEGLVDIKDLNDKPKWCPLKPLKENYISIDWLKQSIPFQHEEDQTILLSMLESWSKHE